MKKKLYLLDSYFAIKKFIPLIKKKNIEVICLNESLVFYLRSKSIKAKSIYEYFKLQEISQIQKKSQIILEKNINILDQEVKKKYFFKKNNIQNFFNSIYQVNFEKTFYSYCLIKRLFEKKIKISNFEITIFYSPKLIEFKFPIFELIKLNKNFKNIKIKKVEFYKINFFINLKYFYFKIDHLISYITKKINSFFLKKIIKVNNFLENHKEKILILNHENNLLRFLKKKHYKLIFFDDYKISNNNYNQLLKNTLQIIDNNKKISNEFKFAFKSHLLENKKKINLDLISNLSNDKRIKYIIWRYPVGHDYNRSLLVKNNLKKKTIIGFQHGAHYLEKKEISHLNQDFNNCNYWMSYYGTESDYKRLYRSRSKISKIISQDFKFRSKRKKVFKNSFLYPIRQIHHLYSSGIEEKIVLKKQILILNSLEKLKRTYFLKTIFPISRESFALIDLLKDLKYAKIITGISLKNYLKKYEHKSIILDNYETTLYDSIEYSSNSKILLFDKINNSNKVFYKQLKKRAPERLLISKNINLLNRIKIKKNFKIEKKVNFDFNDYDKINKVIK